MRMRSLTQRPIRCLPKQVLSELSFSEGVQTNRHRRQEKGSWNSEETLQLDEGHLGA